ncbi:U4/U6-U5 snRNP complex subunit [Saccharomycopsis crataegensis]|uniref:U4/U6-U5 snRNP complex subunit n=1 Tax=Saccharomycopsis crataegensis TaxID=43959 RepID=A0AAV5QF72_9ASCO|nr:U4/U6-U5 snRNP complex subunit [Saccharomycopsis crataegensis]
MSDPSKFLSGIRGERVVVKLHSGIEYKGRLQSIDSFMNIVLHDSSEHINNNLTHKYNDMFIRGNNVLYISAD